MAVIDPAGLFKGARLKACSDQARFLWPYLFLAANGFARLELSFDSIISEIFGNFRTPPKQDEIWACIEEYHSNYLLILYEFEGIMWAQFDTSEKYLKRRKTVKDMESPIPPAQLMDEHRDGYIAWKSAKSQSVQRFRKLLETSERFRAGIGIGVGEGVGVGKNKTLRRSAGATPNPHPAPAKKTTTSEKTSQDEPASPVAPETTSDELQTPPESGATLATHIKEHGIGKERHPPAIDPRHTQFKAEVLKAWSIVNKTECPWSAAEGKSMQVLLRDNPGMQLDQFSSLLSNRYRSDVNPTDLPRSWLTTLRKYESGPLKFGKPEKTRIY